MRNATAMELVPVEAVDEQPPESRLTAATPLPVLQVPPPRKPSWATLAALAIVTGITAVGLGAWALFDEARSESATTPDPTLEWSVAVLADSKAERFPLRHSVGRISLVVDEAGRALLALDGLGRAPEGSVYEAWLVPPGSATATPVATFDASTLVVPLSERVAPGARVGVTLEPVGGATSPSRPLRLVVLRP